MGQKESVADPPLGLDVSGLLRIAAELLSQPTHEDFEILRFADVLRAPHPLEQQRVRQHRARITYQLLEQAIFGRGELDRLPPDDEPAVQPTEVTEPGPEATIPPIPDDEGNTGAGGMAPTSGLPLSSSIAGGVSLLLLSGYALLRRR